MKKLILASQSPRRKQILKDYGLTFDVAPSDIDEDKYLNLPSVEMVETLSKLKAGKISKENPNAVVVGADTTVDLNDEILTKPISLDEAKSMLKKLSGSTHRVITGFTVIDGETKKEITGHEETKVTFKVLSEKEIDDYIKNNEVTDKAGAYAIQEGAGGFVIKTEGDYLNIVGLPSIVRKYLKDFGI